MWTEQQEAFFDALCNGSDSLLTRAVAGSGKTTALKEGAKRHHAHGISLAFNVKNKKDLEKVMPFYISCMTLNGLGHRAIGKLCRARLTPDSNRVGKLVSTVLQEQGLAGDTDLWRAVKDLAVKAKVNGLLPLGAPLNGRGLVEDTEENWRDIADTYDLDFSIEAMDLAKSVLLLGIKRAFQGEIDFDDQLYIPVCFSAPFQKYSLIYVDEAQDLSLIQHEMLRRSLAPGGRVVAVGDPNQAIYGFRGALADSMDRLADTFTMTRLGLTVCWRCAENIIREAQQYVPDIQWAPGAIPGVVDEISKFNHEIFKRGDTIICRNNGPLIGMAYKLLRRNVGVAILGRDFGKGLVTLLKKISSESDNIPTISSKLFSWQQKEIAVAKANERFEKIETICDKAESLLTVITNSNARGQQDLIRTIESLFSKEDGIITLSTIHRFKGMESDRVFFLDPHLIPSKWATLDHMVQQEVNLQYVGTTRARQELYYISTEGFTKD